MPTATNANQRLSISDFYLSERKALERLIEDHLHEQSFYRKQNVLCDHHERNNNDYLEYLQNRMIEEVMRDVEKALRDRGSFIFNRKTDPMDPYRSEITCQLDVAWVIRPKKLKEEIKEAIKDLTYYDEDV